MINGTKALLYRVGGGNQVIVGQIEITNGFTGAPIEVTSKSDSDFLRHMNGELSTKGYSLTGTIIYNNDAEFRRICDAIEDGTIESYMLDYTTIEDDQLSFSGIPTARTDSVPMGDKITTSITILSTGE